MRDAVEAALRAELAEPVLRSTLGQSALVLARELDHADGVTASVLARELRLMLVEIAKNSVPAARSGLDELRARRAARSAEG